MGRPNFGHVERLGHDHYRVWWGKGYTPEGKRDRHSKTIHGTRQEAELFLARQVGLGSRSPSSVTWGEFWAVYVEPTFDGLAKRTVDDYRSLYLKHLAPRIAALPVSGTDELTVDSVLVQVSAPSTQRHVKDLWRKMCNLAVRRRLLPYCPIDSNTPLKPMRPSRKRLLDATEVRGWMDGIEGHKGELCLLLMLGGGLRPEEAYGLHYSDISEWDGYALVNVERALTYSHGKVLKETKNGFSEREVVMGPPFSGRVLSLLPDRPDGAGIVMPSGRSVHGDPASQYTSPSTACNNYRFWCERKGVVYVPPKNLRASYATLHGEAGSPDSLVSGSMGHSDGTTRGRHYQAITRRGLALIADILGEYLATF